MLQTSDLDQSKQVVQILYFNRARERQRSAETLVMFGHYGHMGPLGPLGPTAWALTCSGPQLAEFGGPGPRDRVRQK